MRTEACVNILRGSDVVCMLSTAVHTFAWSVSEFWRRVISIIFCDIMFRFIRWCWATVSLSISPSLDCCSRKWASFSRCEGWGRDRGCNRETIIKAIEQLPTEQQLIEQQPIEQQSNTNRTTIKRTEQHQLSNNQLSIIQ